MMSFILADGTPVADFSNGLYDCDNPITVTPDQAQRLHDHLRKDPSTLPDEFCRHPANDLPAGFETIYTRDDQVITLCPPAPDDEDDDDEFIPEAGQEGFQDVQRPEMERRSL